MAIKTNKTAGSSAPGTTLPEQPGTDVTPAGAPPAAIEEAQPQRGGSFVRNPDGTLTQTEGHGFAQDYNQPNQE